MLEKLVVAATLGAATLGPATLAAAETPNLGRFSISLTVKDLPKSKDFYEKLGFKVFPPPADGSWAKYGERWVILQNGEALVGLFQGMFEKNTLTFNPTDVRAIQAALKAKGMVFTVEAPEGKGPAFALLTDPDGNPVLIDQH